MLEMFNATMQRRTALEAGLQPLQAALLAAKSLFDGLPEKRYIGR